MSTLVEELDERSLAVIADAADQIGNVVPIKSAGGCQHDEVVSPFDKIGGLDSVGLRRDRRFPPG